MKKFLRRVLNRHSKLGKNRKKKHKWRRPTGRDNKMRERRKGYPKVVSVGYKKEKTRGVEEKKPRIVSNLKELEKIKNEEIIIGKIGKRKKMEIVKKAKEMKIKIHNLNVEKFLKKFDKKPKENKKWIYPRKKI